VHFFLSTTCRNVELELRGVDLPATIYLQQLEDLGATVPPSQTSLSSSGTLARLLLPLIQYSRCCYGSLSTVRRKEGRTLASRIWMPGEPDAEGALCLALCPCVGGLTSRDQRRTDGCSRRGLGCVVARLTPLFVCLYPPRAGPCSGSYPPGHHGRRL
jgi:hypothetical protein